ncbi:uncharacterized protein LOC134192903 [Corticium candelabrum]|uniref:uncharacterized protein LOC134192903 n=1 Tax=Corticium candelabrum TaxID=121492 RepID=UPI002E26B3D1|nr:uncharacterized protein LOC134192903 [Corticium candelabrum]
MNTVIATFAVILCALPTQAHGFDEECEILDCSDCCCYTSVIGRPTEYSCCSCSLAWWAILLIVLAVIFIIAVGVSLCVWRRRVYLTRTTCYTTMPPTQVVTTTTKGGYGTSTYAS